MRPKVPITSYISKDGLVVYDPQTGTRVQFDPEETKNRFDLDSVGDHRCEIAHIELTSKCNRSCEYCYNPKTDEDITTDQWKLAIDKLNVYGIFGVTFGGGEPFLRPDIFELAEYIRGLGLSVCATTNGSLLAKNPERLTAFSKINISYHDDDFFIVANQYNEFRKNLGAPKAGVNFCCKYPDINHLDKVIELCVKNNMSLTLLAYKPIRIVEEALSTRDIFMHALRIHSRYPSMEISIDAACAAKCMASRRFVDIHPNGDISICSFVRDPIGNILNEDFQSIWDRRPINVACPYFDVRNYEEEGSEGKSIGTEKHNCVGESNIAQAK
jgi:MoaA/NifB/PqqE/SkfB family radical SAM enzyme